ncbi:hypothetical protein [Photobacterium damselae]|uniref:hypothetical protein n=1 Tax=Photobacterium damselae TaxID=38293 RepID=UPI001F2F8E03|nr:hypothetical protein [Photobacterium damselae]UKA04883.1 hypothetical protein IHC89_21810 [Photobacterium damselae subsp. damselae]
MTTNKKSLDEALSLIERLISISMLDAGTLAETVCEAKRFLMEQKNELNIESRLFPQIEHFLISEDDNSDETNFYVIYPRGDVSEVSVIDLSVNCLWELSDWSLVISDAFHNHKSAIFYARTFAEINSLKYDPFESRYNRSISEKY